MTHFQIIGETIGSLFTFEENKVWAQASITRIHNIKDKGKRKLIRLWVLTRHLEGGICIWVEISQGPNYIEGSKDANYYREYKSTDIKDIYRQIPSNCLQAVKQLAARFNLETVQAGKPNLKILNL